MKFKFNCSLRLLTYFIFCLLSSNSFSQTNTRFDSLYSAGIDNTRSNIEYSQYCINQLKEIKRLNQIQKAKLNYAKSKVNVQLLKNSLPNNKDTIDSAITSENLLNKAITYIDHGKASKGLTMLYLYLENESEQLNDSIKCLVNIKISEGLRINRDFKNAIDIIENILKNNNLSHYNKSYAYNRLAANYNEMPELSFKQQMDSVIKYSKLSMQISEKYNFIDLLGSSQNELGYIYRLSSMNLELSEFYCTQAFNNFIKAKLYRNAMNTSIILSDIHIRRKEYIKATEPCFMVLDYMDIIGNEDMFMRVYLQLAKSYSLTKKYHEAYEYLSIGRLLEKLIFDSILDEKVNEMTAKYNLAIKESEIAENLHQIKIQQNNIKYLSIILFITIITIIVGILYFLLKRKILIQHQELEQLEKEKLRILVFNKNRELEYKNKELTQSLAHNIDKNNVLRILRAEVNEGKNHKELIDIINLNIDTEQNWKKAFYEFQKLYPDFTPKISLIHPDLSQNETKICILIILKLSTKEIAYVLSVSESAINKSRQRLRKKLNLDKEADLYEYLQTFI
ncbi:MAG: helix-turn-helix transcriptional regulator [Vulcanibacillus sp.]